MVRLLPFHCNERRFFQNVAKIKLPAANSSWNFHPNEFLRLKLLKTKSRLWFNIYGCVSTHGFDVIIFQYILLWFEFFVSNGLANLNMTAFFSLMYHCVRVEQLFSKFRSSCVNFKFCHVTMCGLSINPSMWKNVIAFFFHRCIRGDVMDVAIPPTQNFQSIIWFIVFLEQTIKRNGWPKRAQSREVILFTTKKTYIVCDINKQIGCRIALNIACFASRVMLNKSRAPFATLFACGCTRTCVPNNKSNGFVNSRLHRRNKHHAWHR